MPRRRPDALQRRGGGFWVMFRKDGVLHEFGPLPAAAQAELVCDILSIKKAVDLQQPLEGLHLRSCRRGVPRFALPCTLLRALRTTSFHALAQQLSACVRLLRRRSDVRLEYSAGYSLLHAAAFSGTATLVQLLLCLAGASRAADVDEGGRTPAYLAASQGHLSALLLLLEAAPQTASQPAAINHWCPLIVASKYGRAEAVRLLLQRAPGSVATASLNGRTAAHLAAERNQAEALRLLLAAAPELARSASLLNGSTPLHSAARQGATDALQLLLAAAPEMAEAEDLAGMLPIHSAAFQGHTAAVQLLLAAAPLTAQCNSYAGLTPLRVAIGMRHKEAARCLLKAGPAAAALAALEASGALAHDLFADFVAARCPLRKSRWRKIPSPCPGIGRALPAAFAHSPDQARQVVRCLAAADAERLHTLALCLARLQRRLGLPLPPDVCGCILAAFDA